MRVPYTTINWFDIFRVECNNSFEQQTMSTIIDLNDHLAIEMYNFISYNSKRLIVGIPLFELFHLKVEMVSVACKHCAALTPLSVSMFFTV